MVYKDLNFKNVESDLIDSDAIKASVRNIVLTEINELLGKPEFGCMLKSLLFEQMSMFTVSSAQTLIINSLMKYEPRITDIDVRATPEPAQRKIIINIQYTIKNINIEDNISIRLN